VNIHCSGEYKRSVSIGFQWVRNTKKKKKRKRKKKRSVSIGFHWVGWSTTDKEEPQLSSRSPSPDYTDGTRGRSTRGRDGPIHNLLEDHIIHGSSRRPVPTPRGSEGRPPSSPQRSKPSVARPLLGSPHSKSHPMYGFSELFGRTLHTGTKQR
jgi:hypothetical protein